jgi:hypothetical protein
MRAECGAQVVPPKVLVKSIVLRKQQGKNRPTQLIQQVSANVSSPIAPGFPLATGTRIYCLSLGTLIPCCREAAFIRWVVTVICKS